MIDDSEVNVYIKRLKKISEKIKKNKLGSAGLHWYDDKRKKQVDILLECFQEMKEIGIWGEPMKNLNGFFRFLLLEWGASAKIPEIEKKIEAQKPSSQRAPEDINKDLDKILAVLKRYAENKNLLVRLLNENEFKLNLIREYGSIEKFLGSLKTGIITRPDDPDFDKVYALYDKIFTIEEEKESKEGFNNVMELNTHAKYLKKFGPYEETWIYLEDPQTSEVLAAINFPIYKMPPWVRMNTGIIATIHIIYMFVSDEYRAFNLSNILLGAMGTYARNFLNSTPNDEIIMFSESNAPEKMTIGQYIEDTKNSGLDQSDRLLRFSKMGNQQLDFEYSQLPLSDDAETCNFLAFSVVTLRKKVPSAVILEHLNRFFEMSVLKGKDPNRYKEYRRMRNYLTTHTEVDVIATQDFESLKAKIEKMKQLVKTAAEMAMPIGELIKNYNL